MYFQKHGIIATNKSKNIHKPTSIMNYLPQEIVLDILSRLPVIPILQFKLICKGWLHTAQNPLLASMHFANTGKDDPCLILNCENPSRQQLYSSELSSREEENQKVNKIRVPTLTKFLFSVY